MLSKVKKMTLEQNENINKDIDSIKKNQIEMSELKNTITQLKNSLQGFKNRLDEAEERISELKDMPLEVIQSEEHKEKRMKKSEESLRDYGTHPQTQVDTLWES